MSKIELLHTDCMKYMENIPDRYFDLALVDPPYGIGKTWTKSRRDSFFKKGKLHQYDNKEKPSKKYFQELMRISIDQIIWGGNYFTDYLKPTNSWIIWDKKRNSELNYMSEAEMAWTSFSKVTKIAEFMWNGVHKCENATKIHPHQKPVKLYAWTLKKYARPEMKIFDSHLGSGSSALAAYQFLGDKGEFVGTEVDEGYYHAAIKRFKGVSSSQEYNELVKVAHNQQLKIEI